MAVVFVIIALILVSRPFSTPESWKYYYSGFIGSILGAVFGAFLVWVAWEQLGNLGKTTSADFIHKLDNDFFTPKTKRLMSLIDCGALEFKANDESGLSDGEKPQPYFEVNEEKLDKARLPEELKKDLYVKKYYSAWDIDDLLIGFFENIGMLEEKGIIDFQLVFDEFSWYIETVWESEDIKEYIRYLRRLPEWKTDRIDAVLFNQFQYIAVKCLEYESLHPGLCTWWWKFKRRIRKPKIDIELS
jgi:hypothetical protein